MVWIGGWYSGCVFNYKILPKRLPRWFIILYLISNIDEFCLPHILFSIWYSLSFSFIHSFPVFVGESGYLIVVLICLSWVEMRLNTFSCASWLFAYLRLWSVSSGLLPIFYYVVVIVVYWVLEYFYTLHGIHILEICFANIFSHSLAYLFILWVVLFDEQTFWIVIWSKLFFLLCLFISVLSLSYLCLLQHHESIILYFVLTAFKNLFVLK